MCVYVYRHISAYICVYMYMYVVLKARERDNRELERNLAAGFSRGAPRTSASRFGLVSFRILARLHTFTPSLGSHSHTGIFLYATLPFTFFSSISSNFLFISFCFCSYFYFLFYFIKFFF